MPDFVLRIPVSVDALGDHAAREPQELSLELILTAPTAVAAVERLRDGLKAAMAVAGERARPVR